jgi:transcription initiation factor TFIIA large subunit
MEGGGLMLPLEAAAKQSKRAGKMPTASVASAGDMAQTDGTADDDVKEEDLDDAINSDLDDPEDDQEDSDDEGEELGQQMLCLYDKVQRVKNKWSVEKTWFRPLYGVFCIHLTIF